MYLIFHSTGMTSSDVSVYIANGCDNFKHEPNNNYDKFNYEVIRYIQNFNFKIDVDTIIADINFGIAGLKKEKIDKAPELNSGIVCYFEVEKNLFRPRCITLNGQPMVGVQSVKQLVNIKDNINSLCIHHVGLFDKKLPNWVIEIIPKD